MGAHSTEAPQTPDSLNQSDALGKETTSPSMPHVAVRRRQAACPSVLCVQVAGFGPGTPRPRKCRAGAGGPSAPAAMAVATAAAILAALGGVLWLAARRFVGSNVQRLHQGGDSGLMRGKTVLITGANSGLGRATAAELLRLGARVIMGCRDRERAEEAAGQLRREICPAGGPDSGPTSGGAGELVVKELDLASLSSVRSFCLEMLQVWGSGTCWRSATGYSGGGSRRAGRGGAWRAVGRTRKGPPSVEGV